MLIFAEASVANSSFAGRVELATDGSVVKASVKVKMEDKRYLGDCFMMASLVKTV